jgi:branched-chain amino acid transport system ATP-binding protein
MLVIARAIMASPKLLLLDEPSLGLAPIIVTELFKIIGLLKKEGYTIILSEQNARQALAVADRGYVFETGRIIISGTAAELKESDTVRRAYLGGGQSQ